MQRFVHFVMLAHGWRRALLMLAAGAVAGLSVPPLFVLPSLFVGLPVLVWALDGAETGRGWRRIFGAPFFIGFWFGLGYFAVAIHWIGFAFFAEGGWVPVLAPFGVGLLAAILALFWGAAAALAHFLWSENGFRVVVLAAALALAEFARGHMFTGFPFDLLGYALTANDQMMQAASLVGVYGLSFVAPLVAATPALIWPALDRPLSRRLMPFFAALSVLAAQLAFGAIRLETTETNLRDDMRVRMVQPNIDEAAQWLAADGEFVLSRLIEISEAVGNPDAPGLATITHLIWPESAFPFYLSRKPEALARIARLLPPGSLLITGAPRLDPEDPLGRTARNAILAIDENGEIVASYYKSHLVPFGEYLPFAEFFAGFGITQFVPGNDGWTAGGPRRLMKPPATPAFLPLICYEAVFPGALGPVADAQFILNLTNDGWFDRSIGKEQHFHHARLRAVEQGKPMIRLANTGVSAVIDPLGRLAVTLKPDSVGLADFAPPNPIAAPPFAMWGHLPLLATLLAAFFGALALRRRDPGEI
ncbi:MAG: apolipoprotein N-acyltransferase [Alphaproteobacteria bacterium]|nr:apolipoprotein N-acyltransferase [Alphaproteobacteria bacterium]